MFNGLFKIPSTIIGFNSLKPKKEKKRVYLYNNGTFYFPYTKRGTFGTLTLNENYFTLSATTDTDTFTWLKFKTVSANFSPSGVKTLFIEWSGTRVGSVNFLAGVSVDFTTNRTTGNSKVYISKTSDFAKTTDYVSVSNVLNDDVIFVNVEPFTAGGSASIDVYKIYVDY